MNVLMLTSGSEGDVQPFIALGQKLVLAGHEATLCAPMHAANTVEQAGLAYSHIPDVSEIVQHDLNTSSCNTRKGQQKISLKTIWPSIQTTVLKNISALTHTNVDLILHHRFIPGNNLAEKLNVPAVTALFMPCLVPTDAFPNIWYPLPAPRILNRTTYLRTKYIPNRPTFKSTFRWRRDFLGLAHRAGHSDVQKRPDGAPAVILQGISRHVLPKPLHYPDNVHTTGFWYPHTPANWMPPTELTGFLAEGPAPVCIGFGSMVGADPHGAGKLVSEAVRLAGVRAIIVRGWGGISRGDYSDDICYIDSAPFNWLFKRVSAVVHHGGLGTAAEALAAGVPQVCCPFTKNVGTTFTAERMYSIGVATVPHNYENLNPETLANAIRRAITDKHIASEVSRVAPDIREENGTHHAVRILESVAE